MRISNIKIDFVIKSIFLTSFALLPFSHIDLSYPTYITHRISLNLVSWLCLFSLLKSETCSKEDKKLLIGTILYLFISSLLAYFYFQEISILKEFLSLFTVIVLATYLSTTYSKITLYACLAIITFYCIDAVFQSVYGLDFFQFPKHLEKRAWGAFIMGSPSFGVYLMCFFFLPLLSLKEKWHKLLYLLLFMVALFVANDRAPFLQLPLAVFIILRVSVPFKLFFLLFSLGLAYLVLHFFPGVLPYRIHLLIKSFFSIIQNPEILFENSLFSLDAYMGIWSSNLKNWFFQVPFFNKIFGFGWGGGDIYLSLTGENPRNHQIYLDILFNLGVIGVFLFGYFSYRMFRRLGKNVIIFFSAVLPFSFYSLHTFTWLYLIGLTVVFSFWSHALALERSNAKC